MEKRLFLLDGMALVYRAHFAFISRPILTSKGFNTSALYGFTQTLLEIIKNQNPTHVAVAFDTDAPTPRHAAYADYKATRQAMPEDLSQALPHVLRLLDAFNIPVLTCDGYEADDIIGTLVQKAEKQGFKCYMVTPDKDFAQLVTENTLLYRPSRMGDAAELWGIAEVHDRMGVAEPRQVIELKALAGDSSDNIPGVPGIGEKTACKLIAQYGTVENLLQNIQEIPGKLKEKLEKHRADALLSKQLATILLDAPCPADFEALRRKEYDAEKLKQLFIEFEFNTIGRRLFGNNFRAAPGAATAPRNGGFPTAALEGEPTEAIDTISSPAEPEIPRDLKTLPDIPHTYEVVDAAEGRKTLVSRLVASASVAMELDTDAGDPKLARIRGIAFCSEPHKAAYVSVPRENILEELLTIFESEAVEKTGHNLKFMAAVLRWHGIEMRGPCFDTMIAHSLIEPERRHNRTYLSELYLGYSPIQQESSLPLAETDQNDDPTAAEPQGTLLPAPRKGDVQVSRAVPERTAEAADVTWQLRCLLEPRLKEKAQQRVFYEIETPLVPVLVDMEFEGVRVDAKALSEFSSQLSKQMYDLEKRICQLAGREFNLNSAKQLGEVFFDVLKICEKPKKTRTGQYATDEQTLAALAPDHEIVRLLMEYRVATKLKSTYADALPGSVFPRTGRIHTNYRQTDTATGRLSSDNPNLQNIPIRTERGQEIRKAFVPRNDDYLLLSCDYSQIELRIIAALSREPGLLEAFRTGADVHTATAARVFAVEFAAVTAEMRRKAKMVNYGIAYGISAFGLAQRLGIPRKEGAEIIEQYFQKFAGIRRYMDETIEFAREKGYVETVAGRRRYIRDIRSANFTTRSAAERNAINAPIQGTAADMIKLAMIAIHRQMRQRRLKTRMLLQVHDELVFDLYKPEQDEVVPMVQECMKTAIPLEVPIVVEVGIGRNWLEAH
jgi:DNA polymerase-1